MLKSAIFSDCRKYRYTLDRVWDESKGMCMFICLNPSTADETNEDPTVRRCITYAKIWGYGSFRMTNVFAYRSTDPSRLVLVDDPIGPENDKYIKLSAEKADIIVAAWGNGANSDRIRTIIDMKNVSYLKLTLALQPSHPLYLRKSLKPLYYETGKPVTLPGSGEKQGVLF